MNPSPQLAHALYELNKLNSRVWAKYTFIGLEDKQEAEYLISCCRARNHETSYSYYADIGSGVYKVSIWRRVL